MIKKVTYALKVYKKGQISFTEMKGVYQKISYYQFF